MFDLFRSRAKAVRYLLGGLLMLVAISMVVTLIPGYGTGGGANDPIVAEIGKDTLTMRDVQMQVQNAMRNRMFPPELASVYVPMIVDQMIAERALAYEARRLGFQVTETDLAQGLQRALPQLFQNGQFVGKDVYAAFLAQQNTSIPEFEARFRAQMLVNKLREIVLAGVVVTPQEIEQEFRKRNEKIKLEYVVLTPAKFKGQINVTTDEIKAYYEQNKATFRTPERRNLQVLVADEAKIGASITIPESELRRMYDQNREQFRTPERVQVRHILLKTTDKPASEVPKIQAKAEDILKQLKSGADFAELAKKYSEDPGSAAKGGDLGWIVRGQTVKAFEDTAFSLPPKQLSNVIKTEYGFHIIQVLAKEPARVKPFEEVKNQLEQERKRQQVYDTMQRLADQAHDQLAKNPSQGAQIAQQLGLQLIPIENYTAGSPLPEIGASKEIDDTVSSLPKGGVTPVVQIGQNKLAVAVVTNLEPSRPAELPEVEAKIRETLIDQKTKQAVERNAKQIADQAKSGDLRAAAKALGLEVKTTQEFDRNGAADGIGPANYVEQGFSLNPGAVFGPVAVNDQRFVCKVVDKVPADMSKLAAQRQGIQMELKSKKAQERNDLFEEGLMARLIKDGKIKKHQETIKRVVATYRS